MEQVCRHFQCGYCKFGETCRKYHMKEICPTEGCTNKSCLKRHPKMCKFFIIQQRCKFGEKCSYKHVKAIHKNYNSELINKIVFLEGSIEMMKGEIAVLSEEIDKIKKNTHVESKEIVWRCEHCEYTGRSSSVLKRHITMKHRTGIHPCEVCDFKASSDSELKQHTVTNHKTAETPRTPERERGSDPDISLELVASNEKRLEEDIEHSSPPSSISKQKCSSSQCTNQAENFFSTTNIFKIHYKNIFICDACTRFIPLKELKKNPPIKV